MRRLLKASVVLFLSLASIPHARGQVDFQSCDPVGDSIVVARMRAKMDRIRKHRPTVAVVLSGGGAKGAAHVGALRYFEEIGIPVDMILGTSMGGLVGGLYSVGYSPDFLDSLLRSVDWGLALSDRVPQDLISYQQKKYKEKYLLSFPFYYSKDSFLSGRPGEEIDAPDGKLHLGAGDEFSDMTLKQNLFGSLPSGYISGQNVNNIISGLTVGYQDDTNFTELPIPFFCVAGELVSGKAKLWSSGKLNTALRSTMSIPGIFAPVRTDGMILVDGGIRNNYPTDIARAMGADIVIGVELSDTDMTYSDIHNIAEMAWQIVDILGRDSFEKNVGIPDVTIKPDLTGYNMMSFSDENIEIITRRGYEAARGKEKELMALKERTGPDTTEFQNPPATDIGSIPIVLSGIQFEGLAPDEVSYLLGKIDIKAWDRVYKQDIEQAVSTIFATKSFDFVKYELLQDNGAYILNLICQKGPVHQVGIGTRIDSETMVSAIINVGLNVHRVEGASWDFTAKIGSNPYLNAHYMFRFARIPTFNAEIYGGYTNVNLFDIGTAPRLNLNYWKLGQKAYLSDLNWKTADFKLGIKGEKFNVTSLLSRDYIPEEYYVSELKNYYLSAFAELRRDSFDDGYFPSRGVNAGISYDYLIGHITNDSDDVHIVRMDASRVYHLTGAMDMIPMFYSRFAFGGSVPLAYMNVAGGSLQGRYMEQQVPFIGIGYATPFNDKMLMLRDDLRLHLSSNNYISLIGNLIKSSDSFDENLLWKGDTTFGFGVEYAYDSVLGPIKANINWSNLSERVGFYLSMGFDF